MNAMLGDLPTWNLSDLYSSPSGPDLDADLKRAAADAESFAKDYEGKVAGLDGKALGAAVAEFEALNDLMGRIGSYASLYYAQDMADPERGRFSQDISQALTDIGAKLVFFRLEINKLDDADLAAKQQDPALAKYGAVAARPQGLPAAPALRRAGEGAARKARRRPRRLVAPVRRDHRPAALSLSQRGADRAADPRQALEQGCRCAQGRRQVVRQGAGRQYRASSRWSPIRWPRTRRSRIAGANTRGRNRR